MPRGTVLLAFNDKLCVANKKEGETNNNKMKQTKAKTSSRDNRYIY